MPLRPDPNMDSYWIEKGSTGGADVFSSDDAIVTLSHASTVGGYLRCVTATRRGRRFVPALLAGLLAPLRWSRSPEGLQIDPDIYAMH